MRREKEDDEDEAEEDAADDDDDEEEEALESVRFLGVNVEGLAVMASYVGRRSMLLVLSEDWNREDWCMMTGCLRMFLCRVWEWNRSSFLGRKRKLYVDNGTTIPNMKQCHKPP